MKNSIKKNRKKKRQTIYKQELCECISNVWRIRDFSLVIYKPHHRFSLLNSCILTNYMTCYDQFGSSQLLLANTQITCPNHSLHVSLNLGSNAQHTAKSLRKFLEHVKIDQSTRPSGNIWPHKKKKTKHH